ncbi:hypothetical protein JCM5350_002391 [Sporobolomyces pararoseus]
MPIPYLPFEIILEISSHLEPNHNLTGGGGIVLVCRAWRTIGEEIIWKRLEVTGLTVQAIEQHFRTYPRLRSRVRTLCMCLFYVGYQAGHAHQAAIVLAIRGLMGQLTMISTLHITGVVNYRLYDVLSAARSMSRLQEIVIRGGRVEWRNQMNSLVSRLTQVVKFTFYATDLNPNAGPPNAWAPWSNVLPLRDLTIGWTRPLTAATGLVLSQFQQTTLSTLTLLAPTSLDPVALAWASRCRYLVRLVLLTPPNNVSNLLSSVAVHLPNFACLEHLQICVDGEGQQLGTRSTTTLLSLLAHLPATLRSLDLDTIIFPDLASLPRRHFPNSRSQIKPKVRICHQVDPQARLFRFLTVWGEEIAGRKFWFYHEEGEVPFP